MKSRSRDGLAAKDLFALYNRHFLGQMRPYSSLACQYYGLPQGLHIKMSIINMY